MLEKRLPNHQIYCASFIICIIEVRKRLTKHILMQIELKKLFVMLSERVAAVHTKYHTLRK